jgi:AraC-like DNA-binding protein
MRRGLNPLQFAHRMDPLSEVLAILNPRGYAAAAFDFGGDWCVDFERHAGIKCYALVSGQGWLAVDGVPEAVLATAGDCVLLPQGRPFRVASDLALAPVDARTLYGAPPEGLLTVCNGGGAASGFASHFELDGPASTLLLETLPPLMHFGKASQRATLRWCLERMMQELVAPEAGGGAVLEQLARMVLVEALRQYVAQRPADSAGWLFALGDVKLSGAIQAMHDDPARAWSVQSLAQHVGMSRTNFTLKFKATVGRSPMDYLLRWRMMLAAHRLRSTDVSMSLLAETLGYESDSAFSTAFKRVMGCSPRQYGKASATGRTDALQV